MANNSMHASQVASRPLPKSHHSASLPGTPRQSAHDLFSSDRTPSPSSAINSQSPRSTTSDTTTRANLFKSNSSTTPSCRFQTTQTARRRMPYESNDPLPPDPVRVNATLDEEKECKLDQDISKLYRDSLPSDESQARRDAVASKIRKILRDEFPNGEIQVSVFGSSGNLLNTDNSDVDICVTMEKLDFVCTLASIFAKHEMKSVKCVHAKGVPIVKIWDPEFRMSCDLNVNNHLALVNTKLVKTYMEIDERARILAMAVKFWTKRRMLNEASGGGLSSYTWTLLVISFLQTCEPPILPGIELQGSDGRTKLGFEKDAERYMNFGQANKSSAGSLLFQFFRSMGYQIDYDTAVLSVRAGKRLTKSDKQWEFLVNQRLCCEEPFNTARNLGNTADEFSFRGIHLEIRKAFECLLEDGSFRERVCEQYSFPPPSESRPMFERPAPGPRPVTLTRSTSQTSNRGGRHNGNRGNRMRSDPRNGGSSRRASSASTYNNDSMAPFVFQPMFVQQGIPAGYFLPAAQIPTQMVYERSQQVSDQIDTLRQQQVQLALYTQNIQKLQFDQERHAANSSPAMQHRHFRDPRQDRVQGVWHDGLASPILSTGNATFRPTDSPPSMSHSSSHQGTSTNPSSPMLPQVPLRRTPHRGSAPESPGAAIRSQSQPARGYFPPVLPAHYPARTAYPSMLPAGYGTIRQGQQQIYSPSVYMPYGFLPQVPLVYPSATAQEQVDNIAPREYVGFSYSSAQNAAPGQRDLQQIPAYEDLHRQSRSHSPARRSPLIHAEASTDVPVVANGDEPALPLPANGADLIDGSLPISNRHETTAAPKETSQGPLIVNGSFSSPNLTQLAGQRAYQKASLSGTVASKYAAANGSAASQSARKTSQGSELSPLTSPSIFGREAQAWKSPKTLFASEDTMPKKEDLAPHRTPVRGAEDSSRRLSQSAKLNVPPLDIGAPVDRLHTSAAAAATLSPVREQPTPSPTEARRMSAIPTMNGHKLNHSYGHAVRNSISGPPPSASKNVKNGSPPSFGLKSAASTTAQVVSPAAVPNSTSNAAVGPAQSNEWQQAPSRKNGRKKSGQASKSGGQPMPANASERKGG